MVQWLAVLTVCIFSNCFILVRVAVDVGPIMETEFISDGTPFHPQDTRHTHSHTDSHFSIPRLLTYMFLDSKMKLENPEETHLSMRRTDSNPSSG